MGLDISHDAFCGSYGRFNWFRKEVARSIGGSFPLHDDQSLNDGLWYWGDGYSDATHPGLKIFLDHSDCEGEISVQDCGIVASDLKSLLNKPMHWEAREMLEIFIAGAQTAHELVEPLEFN